MIDLWLSVRTLLVTGNWTSELEDLVKSALIVYFRSEAPLQLGKCMRIPPPASAKQKIRDHILRELAGHYSGDVWYQAGAIRAEWLAFRSNMLKRWQRSGVPTDATPKHRLMWEMYLYGASVPTSRQRIAEILDPRDKIDMPFNVSDHILDLEDRVADEDPSAEPDA